MVPEQVGGADKQNIQAFWHDLQTAVYAEDSATMSREVLADLLQNMDTMFRRRGHLAVTEMPLGRLRAADVLEIGCGNGAHSALFAYRYGARMTSIDITPSRALATGKKLDSLLPRGDHLCLQADAERLPFGDESFDVVYSNGVLHHTPDTEKAVNEVHRVLKPGGSAVIMLYARYSFQYWVTILLLEGVLRGGLLRGSGWMGRGTEWMGSKRQQHFNPETKVYSVRQLRRLFAAFHTLRVRKNSFRWEGIPGLGKILEWLFLRGATRFPGGRLVYGAPFRPETTFELWLGRHIGFGLNVLAEK